MTTKRDLKREIERLKEQKASEDAGFPPMSEEDKKRIGEMFDSLSDEKKQRMAELEEQAEREREEREEPDDRRLPGLTPAEKEQLSVMFGNNPREESEG